MIPTFKFSWNSHIQILLVDCSCSYAVQEQNMATYEPFLTIYRFIGFLNTTQHAMLLYLSVTGIALCKPASFFLKKEMHKEVTCLHGLLCMQELRIQIRVRGAVTCNLPWYPHGVSTELFIFA